MPPEADAGALLRAEGVRCRIDGADLLRGASLTVRAGELVGLIGPNGAGKSTLLRVVSGLWPLSGGTVTLLGRPLSEYAPRQVAQIVAQVPQITALDFPFTVRQVVLMGRSPHQGRFTLESARDRQIAERAMRRTGTLDLAERLIGTLSGGERQRVLIARALTQEPRLLLLDEPTANLDLRHQLSILALVRALVDEGDLGAVAAVHDLELAARACDRLVLLHEGAVLAAGSPAEVLTSDRLRAAYGVDACPFTDPVTGHLRIAVASG